MDMKKIAPKTTGYYYFLNPQKGDKVEIVHCYQYRGKLKQISVKTGEKEKADVETLHECGCYWSENSIAIPGIAEINLAQ